MATSAAVAKVQTPDDTSHPICTRSTTLEPNKFFETAKLGWRCRPPRCIQGTRQGRKDWWRESLRLEGCYHG